MAWTTRQTLAHWRLPSDTGAAYHGGVLRRDASSSRLLAALTAMSLVFAPLLVHAKGLDPEAAAEQRDALEAELADVEPRDAAEQLRAAAEEQGDPELFLAASARLFAAADAEREPELAEAAIELAKIAEDIGLYLADERNFKATNWRPVSNERAAMLAEEAAAQVDAARELIAAIEEERRAAAEAAARQREAEEQDAGKRERKPGTGLIIGGSVALVAGVAGGAMLGAGLAMGAARQREADALDLPTQMDRLDELDRQGQQANVIAGVGGALAGVGLATGIALVIVGVKKRKAAGDDRQAARRPQWMTSPWFNRDGAGLSVTASF